MADLPVVCIFGAGMELKLKSSPECPDYETNELDCRCYETDESLMEVVAVDRPMAILSIGDIAGFNNLTSAPIEVRRKWKHYDCLPTPDIMGRDAFSIFLNNAFTSFKPAVSVFTAAYNSGDKIFRPYHSLLNQTHGDWEWVVVDDCSTDKETIKLLEEIASNDPRVRLHRMPRHSGSIGEIKRVACDLCHGELLAELDHDDHIVAQAVQWLKAGFSGHPEVGFIYTDFAECQESGEPVTYGYGWGFRYGSYRTETYGGMEYAVANSPNINSKTIRHIVAAPNHIRAWRKSVYDAVGGHNPDFHVADDYELMVRTFLATRMGRIPKMAYVQYRNSGGNTHRTRNAEIQRLVRCISKRYDECIHARFVELGVDDFVWEKGSYTFDRLSVVGNPEVESHCTIHMEV